MHTRGFLWIQVQYLCYSLHCFLPGPFKPHPEGPTYPALSEHSAQWRRVHSLLLLLPLPPLPRYPLDKDSPSPPCSASSFPQSLLLFTHPWVSSMTNNTNNQVGNKALPASRVALKAGMRKPVSAQGHWLFGTLCAGHTTSGLRQGHMCQRHHIQEDPRISWEGRHSQHRPEHSIVSQNPAQPQASVSSTDTQKHG